MKWNKNCKRSYTPYTTATKSKTSAANCEACIYWLPALYTTIQIIQCMLTIFIDWIAVYPQNGVVRNWDKDKKFVSGMKKFSTRQLVLCEQLQYSKFFPLLLAILGHCQLNHLKRVSYGSVVVYSRDSNRSDVSSTPVRILGCYPRFSESLSIEIHPLFACFSCGRQRLADWDYQRSTVKMPSWSDSVQCYIDSRTACGEILAAWNGRQHGDMHSDVLR